MIKRITKLILGGRVAAPSVIIPGRARDRAFGAGYTRDGFDPMAFQFRMGAGFFGEVNRTHPFTVEPGLMDATYPVVAYGQAVMLTALGRVRSVLAADQGASTDVYGFAVRPFPFNDPGTSAPYGAQSLGGFTSPIPNQPIDVLRSGYMLTYVNGTPVKGNPVYVWAAATASPHYLGFLEAAATGGDTFEITGNDKTTFNGPPDANGCGEIAFNV